MVVGYAKLRKKRQVGEYRRKKSEKEGKKEKEGGKKERSEKKLIPGVVG